MDAAIEDHEKRIKAASDKIEKITTERKELVETRAVPYELGAVSYDTKGLLMLSPPTKRRSKLKAIREEPEGMFAGRKTMAKVKRDPIQTSAGRPRKVSDVTESNASSSKRQLGSGTKDTVFSTYGVPMLQKNGSQKDDAFSDVFSGHGKPEFLADVRSQNSGKLSHNTNLLGSGRLFRAIDHLASSGRLAANPFSLGSSLGSSFVQ